MQFQLNQALEVLTQPPAVLDAMLRGRSPAWLDSRKTPASFSPVEVVGHLIEADRTNWIPRVRVILGSQGERTFEPFDRFSFRLLIAGKSIEELLDEFAELRRQSLQALSDLGAGEQQLNRIGIHPELGHVTLRNLLATWVVHDLGHIAQILRAMSSEYRDEVGPWRKNLSILD